jgi:hypothetical protein
LNLDWGVLDVDWCRQGGARVRGRLFAQGLEGRLSLVVVVRMVGLALMMDKYIELDDRQSSQLLNHANVFPRLIRWIYLNVDLPLKPLHSAQHHTSSYQCLGHHRLPQQLELRLGRDQPVSPSRKR